MLKIRYDPFFALSFSLRELNLFIGENKLWGRDEMLKNGKLLSGTFLFFLFIKQSMGRCS